MFDTYRTLDFDEISTFYNATTPNIAKKNSNFFSSNSFLLDSGSTADSCSTPDDNTMSSSMDLDENYDPFSSNFNKVYDQGNKSMIGPHSFKNREKQSRQTDRFIPSRKASKLSVALTPLHDSNSLAELKKIESLREEDPNFSFKCLYKNLVLGYDPISNHSSKSQIFNNTNIFRYNDENQGFKAPSSMENPPLGDCDKILSAYQSSGRKIAKVPFKVLDAPALQDDFYLNLVDWSSQNILAVGLSSCVYMWSAHTSKVTKLCDLGGSDTVTSVAWNPKGTHLSVGTNSGDVQIWDILKVKKVRVLSGHSARVGSIAWSNAVLSSGSRDKNIHNRDLRCSSNYISTLTGHKQEVCGLKWSFDEQQLASGGNDNKLYVWNLRSTSPVLRFANHTAAVKALAWSPHQHGLLASGGGTADRTIRFWNTLTSQQIDCIDTGSQVCNLVFSKNYHELVSTHGYSQNQIVLWKYPTMEKVATLTGHSYRVLYLAMSPDGENIVTGAGDETLRFWHAFPKAKKQDEAATKIIDKLKPSSFDLR